MTDSDLCPSGALKIRVLQTYSAMFEGKNSRKACRIFKGILQKALSLHFGCIACNSGHLTESVLNIQRCCVLLRNFPSFVSSFFIITHLPVSLVHEYLKRKLCQRFYVTYCNK